MTDVGLSNKTVSELKNQKKELDLMSVKTFEKLYKCAIKAEKNAQ